MEQLHRILLPKGSRRRGAYIYSSHWHPRLGRSRRDATIRAAADEGMSRRTVNLRVNQPEYAFRAQRVSAVPEKKRVIHRRGSWNARVTWSDEGSKRRQELWLSWLLGVPGSGGFAEQKCAPGAGHSKGKGACWTGHQPWSGPEAIPERCAVWCGPHRPERRTGRVASIPRPIRALARESRPYREPCPCLSEKPLRQSRPARRPSIGSAIRPWWRVRAAWLEGAQSPPNESQRQQRCRALRDSLAWPDWAEENSSWLATMSLEPPRPRDYPGAWPTVRHP